MGADITIKLSETVDTKKLKEDALLVPIDCDIEGNYVCFHYAYWGNEHAEKCETFVKDFAKREGLKLNKWDY